MKLTENLPSPNVNIRGMDNWGLKPGDMNMLIRLVTKFLSQARLSGDFTLKVAYRENKVKFHRCPAIKIREQNKSCALVVGLSADDQFLGYLNCNTAAIRGEELYRRLVPLTQNKVYVYAESRSNADDHDHAPDLGLSEKSLGTVTTTESSELSTSVSAETTKSEFPTNRLPEASVKEDSDARPKIAPVAESTETKVVTTSFETYSSDPGCLDFTVDALKQIYGGEPFLARGSGRRVAENLKIDTTNLTGMGHIFLKLVESKMLFVHSEVPRMYTLDPKKAMQVVSEQVKTNAQVETDVYKIMNHMDMMDKIREMSKELGKAVENFGLVQADIEKVEKEINAINAKKATLEANLARLGEEKGRIAEIMKSEPHRRARELMIKIRDEDI